MPDFSGILSPSMFICTFIASYIHADGRRHACRMSPGTYELEFVHIQVTVNLQIVNLIISQFPLALECSCKFVEARFGALDSSCGAVRYATANPHTYTFAELSLFDPTYTLATEPRRSSPGPSCALLFAHPALHSQWVIVAVSRRTTISQAYKWSELSGMCQLLAQGRDKSRQTTQSHWRVLQAYVLYSRTKRSDHSEE